jgi:hypothetical protein
MKKALERFWDDIKYESQKHPIVSTALFLLFLVLILGKCCGCTGTVSNNEENWTPTNVAGIYKIISGTQAVVDSNGFDNSVEFTEENNAYIGVKQSYTIVSVFECFGIPNEELEYKCAGWTYDIDAMFGPYFLDVQGKIKFYSDSTVDISVQILGNFGMLEYNYTNMLDVKAIFDKTETKNARKGVDG